MLVDRDLCGEWSECEWIFAGGHRPGNNIVTYTTLLKYNIWILIAFKWTVHVFFTYFLSSSPIVRTNLLVLIRTLRPWGEFGCCKFAHCGPKCRPSWSDSDGQHFGSRWANSRTTKLLSGNSEFLAISGG